MATVKLAQAGEKKSVQVRFGIDVPTPGGMRPDIDPIALGPGDFVNLENVRRIGTSIVGRPGNSVFADLGGALGSVTPTGLADLQIGAKRRLVAVADGCPGESPTIGKSLVSYDKELIPPIQRLVYSPTGLVMVAERFKRDESSDGLLPSIDALVFSVDNVLYRLANLPSAFGAESLESTNGAQQIPVWTIPAAYTSISAIHQHGGELVIAVNGGAGASAIFSWDGVTFRKELDAIDPVTGFATFRDKLIAGHAGVPNLIRIRTLGAAWSTVAPGVGTVQIPHNHTCASFRDVLYIPTGGEYAYSFDGATLTQIPAATMGVDAGSEVWAFETAFEKLYYTWSTAAPKARIGMFDGTTWTATHKDLIAQKATVLRVRTMRFYANTLIVRASITGDVLFMQSPRRNTSGTYDEIRLNALSLTADLTDMVVY